MEQFCSRKRHFELASKCLPPRWSGANLSAGYLAQTLNNNEIFASRQTKKRQNFLWFLCDDGGGSCAAIRRRFLWSLVTLAESDAQANKIDSARWGHHEPIDRACELDFLIPSSALEDLELVARRPGWVRERCRRIRRKPIEAPLPDVAVHVV